MINMNSTPLHSITDLLDSTLRIREIRDASVALNGLQVENNGSVTKVALAVDGSQKTIDDAIAAGCTQMWELAERFGVTEVFMRKAVCYYVHGNLATELYF